MRHEHEQAHLQRESLMHRRFTHSVHVLRASTSRHARCAARFGRPYLPGPREHPTGTPPARSLAMPALIVLSSSRCAVTQPEGVPMACLSPKTPRAASQGPLFSRPRPAPGSGSTGGAGSDAEGASGTPLVRAAARPFVLTVGDPPDALRWGGSAGASTVGLIRESRERTGCGQQAGLKKRPSPGRSWPKHGRNPSKSGTEVPRLGGTASTNTAHSGPASDNFGPISTQFGPNSANFGQHVPRIDQH